MSKTQRAESNAKQTHETLQAKIGAREGFDEVMATIAPLTTVVEMANQSIR